MNTLNLSREVINVSSHLNTFKHHKDKDKVKRLLNQFPKKIFDLKNYYEMEEIDKMCTICQTQFDLGVVFINLECVHKFHESCIE